MGRKKKPPAEPKPALMSTPGIGEPTLVRCWRCGQRLPNLVTTAGGFVCLDAWSAEGWVVECETLRPTADHLARRHRAQEVVRTSHHRERSTARKLAGDPFRSFARNRDPNFLPKDPLPLTPRRIECPQCRAENVVAERRAVK